MASLKYYNSIIILMTVVLYLSLFSFCYSSSQIKSRTHHTLDLSQRHYFPNCINPSPTTNPAAGKDSATVVFEIFNRERLCDAAADGATSSSSSSSSSSWAEKILRGDERRVNLIHHKIMNTNNIHDCSDDHNSIPIESGDSLDFGGYVVRIGLGTPKRNLHLNMDTGSDITWTQCRPCLGQCYKQQDRTFDPLKSTSYSNISCTDPECPKNSSGFDCYKNRTCVYFVSYGYQSSYTIGFLSKEKLTLTQNDVFPNFMFGCGQNNTGDNFGKTAGILGLSRGHLSVVSQTENKYGKYFSYSFPKDINSTGHLTFGRNINNTKNVKFTSLIYIPEIPYFYFIKITSITVGSKPLRIPQSVFNKDINFIDSGTKITRLPKKAYIAMSKEFKRQMNKKRYPIAPAFEILDLCFYVPNGIIEFPTITFTFEGDVAVEVDRSGIVFNVNLSVSCLAFAGHSEDHFSIFGNMAQQNMEVVYDVAGEKLGFGVPAG